MLILIISLIILIAVISISIFFYNKRLEQSNTVGSVKEEPENKEDKEELKKIYIKIWDNAHIASYNKWVSMIGTTIDSNSKRALITEPICKKYEYKYKGGDKKIPFLEWHDEVGEKGSCISYQGSFTELCDTLAEQYGQQKDYFKYVPPLFECNKDGKCIMKETPSCDIPESYCSQQLASYKENERTCAGECYDSEEVKTCGDILGEVACKLVGNQQGFTIGTLLSACNMSVPGSQIQCSPPPGIIIPNTLGKIINITNTSNGYLRPKNLWDTKYAGQLTLNPKSQIFNDSQLKGMIQRQPWFLVSHDSDYKTPMSYFGHYYKIPGFKYYDYIDFISSYSISPISNDNTLHIYTIDLVNFGDWASEISKCKPIETLKRMLTQVMITNFSMRSFNTLAINNEKWADKTKTFELPFEMRISPSSKPIKRLYRDYGVDKDGYMPIEDYDRDRRWKANLNTNTKFITDIILMKWPNGYKIGDNYLSDLLISNLTKLETYLFNNGEYISATKCVDKDTYFSYTTQQRNASVSWMCYYTKEVNATPETPYYYPSLGTKIESKLLIDDNKLICKVIVSVIKL